MALPALAIRAVTTVARTKKPASAKMAKRALSVTMDDNIHNAMKDFSAALGKENGKFLFKMAEQAAGIIRQTINEDWLSKSKWGVSTGTLARSFKPSMIRGVGLWLEVGVFSNVVYAGIHEEGGTIVPKTAAYLAVPLFKGARRIAPNQQTFYPSPRRGSNGGMLFNKGATKGFGKPWYTLRSEVHIKAKHYLKKSAKKVEQELPGNFAVHATGQWDKVAAKYQTPGKGAK